MLALTFIDAGNPFQCFIRLLLIWWFRWCHFLWVLWVIPFWWWFSLIQCKTLRHAGEGSFGEVLLRLHLCVHGADCLLFRGCLFWLRFRLVELRWRGNEMRKVIGGLRPIHGCLVIHISLSGHQGIEIVLVALVLWIHR